MTVDVFGRLIDQSLVMVEHLRLYNARWSRVLPGFYMALHPVSVGFICSTLKPTTNALLTYCDRDILDVLELRDVIRVILCISHTCCALTTA